MQKIVLSVLVIELLLSTCSTLRKKGDEYVSYDYRSNISTARIGEIVNNNITNKNFNIQRADIKIVQGDVSARFTASLKFCRPDSLMITVRSRTGIEAGRALITKDTVMINDRINKALLIGKPDRIGNKYGIEPILIYAVMGDIIIDKEEDEKILNCEKGIVRSIFEINNRRVEYTIDCRLKKTLKTYFEGDITSGNITASFNDIRSTNGIKYPQNIFLSDDKSSMEVNIEIKKIEIPWSGSISFIPGYNYKVVKIR